MGSFDIKLEIQPQRLSYIDSATSPATFVACLTYLTYNYTKSNTPKPDPTLTNYPNPRKKCLKPKKPNTLT